MKIQNVDAFQVYDSRGYPTLEVEIWLENGIRTSAIVPSGASVGEYEAVELRDVDSSRFLGRSVFTAIENVKGEIRNLLTGMNIADQEYIDQELIALDSTPNKSRLGANAIVGTSMAVARAKAAVSGVPLFLSLTEEGGDLLPLPEIQIFGGGAHALNSLDIQDFMIICTSAESYLQCLEMTYEVYHHCGRILAENNQLFGLADEGGYWPVFGSDEEAFDIVLQAIEKAGYRPGEDICISLDIAAAEFWADGEYFLRLRDRNYHREEYYDLISGWCRKYPVISVEDPFAETDIENWKRFTREFGEEIQIIGDDLFATNIRRIQEGKEKNLANSVLIKLNQIGTVTETIRSIRETQSYGWNPVVSARSGETEDAFISHLAVATNAGQLKVGSFARSERMVKWNELIRIERMLGERARFKGKGILPGFKT